MAELDATNPETEVETTVAETPDVPEPQLDENGEPVVAAPVEDETEEVEHDGKKYKIPKPLKGALLMQADYTRKTQEVADQRKQVEAERAAVVEREKVQNEFVTDFGKLAAYDDALKQFEAVDWPTLFRDNRAAYDQLQFQRQQTVDLRQKQATSLQTKLNERNSKAQQETATAIEQFRTKVANEIPGWNPELAGKLDQFALSQGFTADELRQVRDPRIVKVIHAAYLGSQAVTKAAVVKKAEASQTVQPLKQVAANTGTTIKPTDPASDKLSPEEWLKRRNEQLRKKPSAR